MKRKGLDKDIIAIRKVLKKLCPTLLIRRGKGTAYGWIEIRGSGECNEFTKEEMRALKKLGISFGGNFAVISPNDRRFWAERAKNISKAEFAKVLRDFGR